MTENPLPDGITNRIADAEERLRQSISGRIDRNRQELARLQSEQLAFEAEASTLQSRVDASAPVPGGPHGREPTRGGHPAAGAPVNTPPTTHGHEDAEASRRSTSLAPPVLLLRMTVEIGDGRVGEIEVHRGEEPASLAAAFCQRHSLPQVGPCLAALSFSSPPTHSPTPQTPYPPDDPCPPTAPNHNRPTLSRIATSQRARHLLTEHITSNLAELLAQRLVGDGSGPSQSVSPPVAPAKATDPPQLLPEHHLPTADGACKADNGSTPPPPPPPPPLPPPPARSPRRERSERKDGAMSDGGGWAPPIARRERRQARTTARTHSSQRRAIDALGRWMGS